MLLTNGAYEDYEVSGLFKILRDFDLGETIREYRNAHNDAHNDVAAFPCFIVESGIAELIEYEELHFSGYGEIYKWLYCLHPKRTVTLYGSLHPDHDKDLGSMAERCDDCGYCFKETARPATDEEYFVVYPYMRNPETGHRYTDGEYRALHPEWWPPIKPKG